MIPTSAICFEERTDGGAKSGRGLRSPEGGVFLIVSVE